jgi:GTP-binding protein EngB required for normal cell division
VLTKADKLKLGERARQLKQVTAALGLAAEDVTWFSAATGEGRDKLWRRILDCLNSD